MPGMLASRGTAWTCAALMGRPALSVTRPVTFMRLGIIAARKNQPNSKTTISATIEMATRASTPTIFNNKPAFM